MLFHLVCLGWLFFRANSLEQAGGMLVNLFAGWQWDAGAMNMAAALVLLCLPLWLVQMLQVRTGDLEAPLGLSLVPRTALVAAMAWMFVALGNTGGGAFIYFQF